LFLCELDQTTQSILLRYSGRCFCIYFIFNEKYPRLSCGASQYYVQVAQGIFKWFQLQYKLDQVGFLCGLYAVYIYIYIYIYTVYTVYIYIYSIQYMR